GFAVDESTLPEGVVATHRSLFDGSLQGLAFQERPEIGLQGDPEASAGPHDLRGLFERFNHLMLRRLQAQLKVAEENLRRQQAGGRWSSARADPRLPPPDSRGPVPSHPGG